MNTFDVEGWRYNTKRPEGFGGHLEGRIEVSADGSFEGEMRDHSLTDIHQFIKGYLYEQQDNTFLRFLEFPDKSNIGNQAFLLATMIANKFQGRYAGKWYTLPYKIEFDKNKKIFTTRMDVAIVDGGNFVEMYLKRK